MGKIDQTGKNKFTITYGGLDSPMTGVDATHQSGLYINPQALADAGGIISQDGYLNTVFMNPRIQIDLSTWGNNPVYNLGDVQVVSVTQGPAPVITRQSWGFVIVSGTITGTGVLSVLEYRNGFLFPQTANLTIDTNLATNLTWYTVNGVVYITGLGLGAIYAYNANAAGSTLTQLTNYVGGQYLGELNGRLICLACDQITAGVYSYNPFLVSWSAGSGNYSQWNPLVGGLVTGAGFNQLPDVADEITGFFTTGPTGYIIRKQGLSEMTPLNSGIQPFDFNHMWASNKGVGSVFPNSVTQYGSLGGFLSDTGIFTLGYSGITQIEGLFWAEINRLLDELLITPGGFPNNYTQLLAAVVAGLIPLYINNERKLVYALYIPTPDGLLALGNVEGKTWNEVSCYTNTQAQQTQIKPISKAAFLSQGADQSIACIGALFSKTGAFFNQLVLFSLDDTFIRPVALNPPPFLDSTPFAVFPIEEVVMNRDITIDAIGVTADADVNGTDAVALQIGITNSEGKQAAYGTLQFTKQAQFLKSFPVTLPNSTQNGIFTGRYPQLNIQAIMDPISSSSLRVYKIVLYCSFDPGQEP